MLKALLKTMRPKQWAKNGFLLAGLIFDRQITNIEALSRSLIGVLLFSLLASSVYIINDISDLDADKLHPKKKNRPIASGALPIGTARIFVIFLLLVVFPTAYFLEPIFALICGLYFILNLSYSAWFKHIVLLDVLVLASFYVIRVIAGVAIITVERFSPWMYIFTSFLALFLGIGKRRAEYVLAESTGNAHRKVLKSYTLPFLDQLIIIVLTLAILTYSLYTFSAPNLPENHITMLTIPFVIYGIFRYLYIVQVEGRGEAPEEILLSDTPFQINLVLWGISIILIFYFV